jgi:hypothetical protein
LPFPKYLIFFEDVKSLIKFPYLIENKYWVKNKQIKTMRYAALLHCLLLLSFLISLLDYSSAASRSDPHVRGAFDGNSIGANSAGPKRRLLCCRSENV